MISDLPNDVESEILSRVPATLLSQLRSTCKRWYTLFKDPKFVKKHLDKAEREVKVMVLMNLRVHSIIVDLHGIHNGVDPSVELIGKLSKVKDSIISQIFHCDGLILCSTKENKRLVVWNPCTGETRWIKPKTCYKILDTYILGYGRNNSACHSHKLLRFCSYYDLDLKLNVAEFEVYDFNSNSWRVLDDITHKWSMLSSHGVSLKGNTYWVTSDKEAAGFVHILLSFDFTPERFGCLPLPYQSDDLNDTEVLSVVKEEKFALLHQNNSYVKIWVTNTKIDEAKDLRWINFLKVDFNKLMVTYKELSAVMSFLVDEEQKTAL